MIENSANEIIVEQDSTELVPVVTTELQSTPPAEVVSCSENYKKYGYYLGKSHLCSVCNKKSHMEINLMRARDHLSYDDIAKTLQLSGITPDSLKTHFKNHFIIETTQKNLLDLKEQGSNESLEIVRKVFEGELDIFSASMSILESKAKRLSSVTSRLDFLNAHLEIDSVDDMDKQEFVHLNKIATEIEDSMERIYAIMDKKLFPSSKDELSNAVLTYKLGVLSKIIDQVQLVLLELESDPHLATAVLRIRQILADRLGNIEDEILKSGGILKK